jgi:hypothetical protein
MREGESGIYHATDGKLGYSLIMLRRRRLHSKYRDPYLYAIWLESGVDEAVDDPWFYGYDAFLRRRAAVVAPRAERIADAPNRKWHRTDQAREWLRLRPRSETHASSPLSWGRKVINSGLLEGALGRCAHGSLPHRDRGILAPELGAGQGRERLPDPLLVPAAPHARLVRRLAVARSAGSSCARSRVADFDPREVRVTLALHRSSYLLCRGPGRYDAAGPFFGCRCLAY